MIASERYATYRTILAMTGVLLCFLVASISALTESWGPYARRMLAMIVMSIAFFTAQHHVYALIAVPQGNEWQLIMAGAKKVHFDGARPRIFAIASPPTDISTATIYHDEFGSLSTNSEWVPREMFKRAMHDLHPEIPNLDSRYDFSRAGACRPTSATTSSSTCTSCASFTSTTEGLPQSPRKSLRRPWAMAARTASGHSECRRMSFMPVMGMSISAAGFRTRRASCAPIAVAIATPRPL